MEAGIADIQMHAFPEEGEYQYASDDGTSKLIIDTEYAVNKLHGYMYPETVSY